MERLDPEVKAALMELHRLVIELNERVSDHLEYTYSGFIHNVAVYISPKKPLRHRMFFDMTMKNREPHEALEEIKSAIHKLKMRYPVGHSNPVCPLKFKNRKYVLVIHPRRIGRTAALAKLAEVHNG